MYFPECFDSMVCTSDFRIQEDKFIWRFFTTSLPILIKMVLAKNKDNPLVQKASTIANSTPSIAKRKVINVDFKTVESPTSLI